MTEIEETLRRTFGEAAGQAPRLPDLLPERLERIHRRRRRRSRVVLAAAAAVLVAGGTVAVVRGGDTITAVPATQARTRAERPAAPVEQVWPDAVRKIPAKGPGAAPWRPVTLIDERTLLMAASSGFERAAAVYAYDLGSGTEREIAAVPEPEGTVAFASGFAVGSGHVAWWTATKDSVAHFWAAPLDGGTARIVADQPLGPVDDGSGIDGLAVAGDEIVFSLNAGGVFTVPLGGGTVKPVEGGAGMHLLAWPWIGTPGARSEPGGTGFARIRNAETGETRTAVTHPGEELHQCGVTVCVGRSSDGRTFFRHRDGSSQKDVPGSGYQGRTPAQDRFYASAYGDAAPEGVGLYDLDTGRSGDLGIQAKGRSVSLPTFDTTGRFLSYLAGDELHLIDLTEIR
ncbi:hypothetical protein FH608_037685 [Nonomuraea phyllanthi]|uniref:Uncharacterized protein n=1 Tax=Nonomuraea phyllanthi TaxID=2219224 RepID=A0A5C4VQL7_9ACTN|nr:hypothetical protein [Nonomuraea phyllanthi]KAB8189747.1 hypothetical protein FH608_037685 [Nonomuraea phyllanthi]